MPRAPRNGDPKGGAPKGDGKGNGKAATSRKGVGGRPSDFTPENRAAILAAVESGDTFNVAALRGGVTYNTLRRWMRRGEKTKEGVKGVDAEYRAFYHDVKRARAEAAHSKLEIIDRAARGGDKRTKTVTIEKTDATGTVIERTVKTEVIEVEGDWRASAWWLLNVERGEFLIAAGKIAKARGNPDVPPTGDSGASDETSAIVILPDNNRGDAPGIALQAGRALIAEVRTRGTTGKGSGNGTGKASRKASDTATRKRKEATA